MTTFTPTASLAAPRADDSIASFFHAAAISLAGVLALLTVASTL